MSFIKFSTKDQLSTIGYRLPIEDVTEIRIVGCKMRIFTVTGKSYDVHKDFVKIETEPNLCPIPN